MINGKNVECHTNEGYVAINMKSGDVISLALNTKIKREIAEIDENIYAGFSYGTIVLVPDTNICHDIYDEKDINNDFVRNTDTEYNIEFDSAELCLVDYASAANKHESDEYTEWVRIKR